MIPIFARDLVEDKLNDQFMGTGFEKALIKSEESGDELIVGYFDDSWRKDNE